MADSNNISAMALLRELSNVSQKLGYTSAALEIAHGALREITGHYGPHRQRIAKDAINKLEPIIKMIRKEAFHDR